MKFFYIISGSLSLALGAVGIFMPLLPTTPFLLLAAFCYYRGSPRMYRLLLKHKYLGPYLRNFRENKTVPLRGKILCMVFLWGTILYCVIWVAPALWLRLLLLAVAGGVSWHVLSYKTGG